MKQNLEEIYKLFKPNIFAIGFTYFKNAIEADDVVQETFYKYYMSDKDFDSLDHIKNWLIRVAVNECKRVTLSTWFKRKEPLENYVEKLTFTNPEQSQLFIEVMNLPQKYRQVIHLYYYEGYSIKEIAEIMEISPSAVSTRLERGRKKLKEKLLEVWKYE